MLKKNLKTPIIRVNGMDVGKVTVFNV